MHKRDYECWYSASLQREMEVLVFGHAGARVLAFPPARGRFYDWEDHGLVAALADPLERGWIQLYCVDTVDAESWYDRERSPAERVLRHHQYHAYLLSEVLPHTAQNNDTSFVIAAGVDFGAYHAVNFSFRHPEMVARVLGLSGLFDIRSLTDGYSDSTVYVNNPCEYIGTEQDAGRLDALRRLDVILAVGRDDPLEESTMQLSRLLFSKNIKHAVRIWDGIAHDWPVWQKMLQLYIGGPD